VFENRVLWRKFGPERDEETGNWRKLHEEELYGLYCSQNISRVIKSTGMILAGHVERMRRGEVYTGFFFFFFTEREHMGDPGVDGGVILGLIFRKWNVGVWTGSSWLSIGTRGGHL
jgi:hypothetical protein